METIFKDFGLSVSVLLSMTLVFFLFTENNCFVRSSSRLLKDLIFGLILAAIGLLVMATHMGIGSGVLIDARSILLGLVGAFFGWLPALITVLACSIFRIYEGGSGTIPGILIILVSTLIGLAWRGWRRDRLHSATAAEMYLIGFAIHLVMVAIIAGSLPEIRAGFLKHFVPLILLVYPLVFMALALLMRARLRHDLDRAKLESSRARYRNLFINIHLPMFLIDPEDGTIVNANPATERFYGWSPEDLMQMKIADLNTLSVSEVASKMAQAKNAEVSEFEFQHRLRSGELRDVLVRSGPVEIDGRSLLYSIIADQSESKRLMQALRASEAKAHEYVRAIERCRVSIVFTDADGQIEYVNPYFCELTGYSADDVIGRNPQILNSGVQSKSFYRHMWATIKAGQIWEGEFCNRRKDGTEYWESAVISPIKDKAGCVEKFVGVKHNITEQKQHAKAMKAALCAANAANEAKAAFLSVMSHELRTPLNQILGPCELVAEELPDGELKQMLKTAAQAASHLTGLVQRILNFSEVGGESESVLRRIEHVNRWIEPVLQKHADVAAERGCSIELTVDDDVPESFLADEAAFSEILDALVDNALEHANSGTVRVELSQTDAKMRLAVVDAGPQLSASQREQLFIPFQQLDMSRQRSHAGIGLSLCLCRRYATRCGGSIDVKADRSGGNRFEFVFPITLPADTNPLLVGAGGAKDTYLRN